MESGLFDVLPVETGPSLMPLQSESYKLLACIGHYLAQAAACQNQELPVLGEGLARPPPKKSNPQAKGFGILACICTGLPATPQVFHVCTPKSSCCSACTIVLTQ